MAYNSSGYYVNPPEYQYVRDCVYTFDQPVVVINTHQPPLVFNQHTRDRASFRRQNTYNERYSYVPTEHIAYQSEGGGNSTGFEPQRDLQYNYCGYNDYQDGGREPSLENVKLYFSLCCDNCERKVKDVLQPIQGVTEVILDQWEKKVVVFGYNLNRNKLLKRLRRIKSSAAFWSDSPN